MPHIIEQGIELLQQIDDFTDFRLHTPKCLFRHDSNIALRR